MERTLGSEITKKGLRLKWRGPTGVVVLLSC
jgi:hypothetical protein